MPGADRTQRYRSVRNSRMVYRNGWTIRSNSCLRRRLEQKAWVANLRFRVQARDPRHQRRPQRYSNRPNESEMGLAYILFLRPILSAALTVCSRSMAIVIGPTPPGTGAISEAIASASSRAISPMAPCQ